MWDRIFRSGRTIVNQQSSRDRYLAMIIRYCADTNIENLADENKFVDICELDLHTSVCVLAKEILNNRREIEQLKLELSRRNKGERRIRIRNGRTK